MLPETQGDGFALVSLFMCLLVQKSYRFDGRSGARPGGGDDLAKDGILDVAGREHAWHAGPLPTVGDDIPSLIEFELSFKKPGVGHMPNVNEHTVRLYR